MANNPSTLTDYNGQVNPPSAEYPYGSARDDGAPGDLTGTPRVAAELKDLEGMQQALLVAAGLIPSGIADQVGASQYLEALRIISGARYDSADAFVASTVDPAVNTVRLSSYYPGWGATVVGPQGAQNLHRTGANNLAPSEGIPVPVSTIGHLAQAGYYFDASGAEWRLSGQTGEVHVYQFGAKYDDATDDTQAHHDAQWFLAEGGRILLGEGISVITATLRDDIRDPSVVGKTTALVGVGATEDPTDSGKVTILRTVGAIVGIQMDGNRSGGRDFTIKGDGGVATPGADNIVSNASRAQWFNVVSRDSRGDNFKYRFGNSSYFVSITLLGGRANGMNSDGTGYVDKGGTPRPNDLNASVYINIDPRANALVGFRTGVNSGFANNCYQLTPQGNGGVGAEFNGNDWNVYGFYGENNDSAGTGKDIRFSPTASRNTIYGQFSNSPPAWEDLSADQRNYIAQYRMQCEEYHTQRLIIGEDTTPNGYLVLDGEGDGVDPALKLVATASNQVLKVTSVGGGQFGIDPDFITLDASVAPTLLNSWVNFGGSRKVAGFYVTKDGQAYIEGSIMGGTIGTVGAPVRLFSSGLGIVGGRQSFPLVVDGTPASGFIEGNGDVYMSSGATNGELSLNAGPFRVPLPV